MGGPRFLTTLSLSGDASPATRSTRLRLPRLPSVTVFCLTREGDYRQALVACQEENTRCWARTPSIAQHTAEEGLRQEDESGFRASTGTFVAASSNFRHGLESTSLRVSTQT